MNVSVFELLLQTTFVLWQYSDVRGIAVSQQMCIVSHLSWDSRHTPSRHSVHPCFTTAVRQQLRLVHREKLGSSSDSCCRDSRSHVPVATGTLAMSVEQVPPLKLAVGGGAEAREKGGEIWGNRWIVGDEKIPRVP